MSAMPVRAIKTHELLRKKKKALNHFLMGLMKRTVCQRIWGYIFRYADYLVKNPVQEA